MTTGLIPVAPGDYYEWFDLSTRPLLALALKDRRPVYGPRFEWLSDRLIDGRLERRLMVNYTQIFRQPFMPRLIEGRRETFAQAARTAGEDILDAIEHTLWFGVPRRDYSGSLPWATCGGVQHYLRRQLYENDTVILRELRPLMLRRIDYDRYDVPLDNPTGEWLTELTLQVNPGHYERGMAPVLRRPKLPERGAKANAWPQGATVPIAA